MLKTFFLTKYFNFIKFEHSVFALPFCLSCVLLAKEDFPKASTVFWIISACVSARALAMSLNRIIDKEVDKKNERTKNRELPIGLMSLNEAIIFSLVSFSLLVFSTFQLPRICLYLLPVAAAWFYIYPFTKRFTWLSHLWLGIALGGSCIAGWIAVTGKINSVIPFILSLAVVFWVAGFDIIYACQDYNHDMKNNLHSIPARFGIKSALIVSRSFHLITVLFLILLGVLIETSILYWFSVIFVAGMLFYEQGLVKPNDLSKVDMAFFTLNGWISVGFFVFILMEKILK